MAQVIKRDGTEQQFEKVKIVHAIMKAMDRVGRVNFELANKIADSIEKNTKQHMPIEEIEIMVENKLMVHDKESAREYITYRNKRKEIREDSSAFMNILSNIIGVQDQDIMQENANVDGESPMGMMGKIGYESSKIYATKKFTKPHIREAIENNYIHPHDWDFMPTGTTTCCQIPLGKLLETGFNTGHGHLRTPKSIQTASSLAAIILQANQNMQHGGQAFPTLDYDLAPYVKLTNEKNIKKQKELLEKIGITTYDEEKIAELAWNQTKEDTYQAMEGFVHNMNSMNSRSAGQVPFTSVNYGTDTSKEGRLIVESILKATDSGLGKGETPIFPIQIFKVKEGINFNKEDANYDLFQLACKVSSKRLFPNFAFIDSSFNKEKYVEGDPSTEIAYMGCRTRTLSNINGKECVTGRGNLSFTTINLAKIAIESDKDISLFFEKLDNYIKIATEQLYERYKFQCSKKAKNFKFLMRQGVWMDSEKLSDEDTLESVLKHGTLSVGFVALAEALVALTGKHHGEDDESQKLGLKIIEHMREVMDKAVIDYNLNFSLLATPAESVAGKFLRKDKAQFGIIDGVTDRDYYTNSFHVPVYYKTTIVNKIKKEAPFHNLCNAGHISYVELDGAGKNNPQAFEQIVRYMKEQNIGYGSINHPVDRCPVCGFSGIIGTECPECHAKEQDGVRFERIRRVTGYLTGTLERWNTAKQAEHSDRVKHS